MIKAQAWIFLTVGLGLSLLVGVVFTVLILRILAKRNKRRERRYHEIKKLSDKTNTMHIVGAVETFADRKTLKNEKFVYHNFHLV